MNRPEMENLKEAWEKTTPRDWEPCTGSGTCECTALHWIGDEQHPNGLMVCDFLPDYMLGDAYKDDVAYKPANMNFVMLAHNEMPALLEYVERLEKTITELRAYFKSNEDCDGCMVCNKGFTVCDEAIGRTE